MKSIFLVKTPLQMLNAVEARHYFNLEYDNCILIIMGDRKSQPQLLMLADDMDEWGTVIVLNDVNLIFSLLCSNRTLSTYNTQSFSFLNKSFFNIWRLNRISKCVGEVDYIFVGYSRYVYMRHFVNITSHKYVVLLDDGNATTQIAKERKEGQVYPAHLGFKKKIKIISKRLLQGVKDMDLVNLSFFTIYNITPNENDKIIKNSFKYIRSRIEKLDVSENIYFLGSPLDESGIICQSDYLIHLSRVKNYFKDKNIIYIAHRRENPDNLEVIKSTLDLEVILFDYPIEYQLAMIGPRPGVLASFVSSALDSCRYIFGDSLKIMSFRLDLDGTPRQKEIESIYDAYEIHQNENFFLVSRY